VAASLDRLDRASGSLASDARRAQLQAAIQVLLRPEDDRAEQIHIHPPHLQDKFQGTRMILDMLCDDARLDRGRVLVDHVEEHTIRHVLEEGFWAGMTLYPVSKCTPARACDMVETYGAERLMVNSAGDWGPSKPTAVPDFILEMRRRRHPESLIRQIVYDNPLKFFSQSPNFQFQPRDAAAPLEIGKTIRPPALR
jgi:predicted metal-dependent TIM-barrel fold hydrolase